MKTFNKEELICYFTTNNKSGHKTREKHIEKNFNGLLPEINSFNSKHFKKDLHFTQKLYNYLYDVYEIPCCRNCGKELKWRNRFTEGYLTYCSRKCNDISELRINRIKETTIKKYGVDSILKNKRIQKRRWCTINNKIVKKIENKGHTVLESNKREFIIKHKDGHVFQSPRKITINRLNQGHEISTIMNPISSIFSTYEDEIKKFLIENDINYIGSDRKILNGKEIDILIPEYNLGIEFNGLYWHSNLFLNSDYHLNKTILANKMGIQLLHVFEDEWILKKDIVKSIIRTKLNIYDYEYNAHDCEIKEVDLKQSKNFLEHNHIQGGIDSEINIGLCYDNKLVSLMSFNKKGDVEYEILRYCDKINTKVNNGINLLLKYFIEEYRPVRITTNVDRRFSNGNIYKQLGFEIVKETNPNSWFVEKNRKLREFNFNHRKEILNETHESRPLIYDCGGLEFELKPPQS